MQMLGARHAAGADLRRLLRMETSADVSGLDLRLTLFPFATSAAAVSSLHST